MTTHANGSATAMGSADSRFSQQEAERFVMEVVDRAGSEGISPEEVVKAFDSFCDMAAVAGIVLAWSQEKITVEWDAKTQKLRIWPSDDGTDTR